MSDPTPTWINDGQHNLDVARLVLEGDEAALTLFDGFVEIAKKQLTRLAASELLQEDLDVHFAGRHP